MSIFKRPIMNHPIFGAMQYGSAYWESMVDLQAFGGPFSLIVRAKREGPSDAQATAMSRLISNAASIRGLASREMIAEHEECGLLPRNLESGADSIWQHLSPSQVEVSDESYYGDGRIAVIIIFESAQHMDFAPAIETADGHFVQVLSGT